MQNMDHTNLNIIELTDADLEAINGGNWIGDVGRAILGALRVYLWRRRRRPAPTELQLAEPDQPAPPARTALLISSVQT